MRRKNRQIKLTLDIPEQYEDDEEFMNDFMETLDENGWHMKVQDEDGDVVEINVSRVNLGDIEIEPEE